MPTVETIMIQLESMGREQTRKIYARHGMAADRSFGVSVADLKKVAKTIKGEHELACAIYDTGNLDAMYLAGHGGGRFKDDPEATRWMGEEGRRHVHGSGEHRGLGGG